MASTELEQVATPNDRSLSSWRDAWSIAQRVALTPFAPKGLKTPESVMAAILFGSELGLGPMQALQNIHVVEGKTACSAELMRAMVARAGHKIEVLEQTNAIVKLKGTRADNGVEAVTAWTIDDARTAGLLGKDNWKKYPRGMLLARATSELCRLLFPDIVLGLGYTPEELGDVEAASAPLVDPLSGPIDNGEPAEGEILDAPAPASDPAGEEIPEAELVDTETAVLGAFEGAEEADEPAFETVADLAEALGIPKAKILTEARLIAQDWNREKLPSKADDVDAELLEAVRRHLADLAA